ncbi:conserved hypothetical protein [Paraburkholderia tropica]
MFDSIRGRRAHGATPAACLAAQRVELELDQLTLGGVGLRQAVERELVRSARVVALAGRCQQVATAVGNDALERTGVRLRNQGEALIVGFFVEQQRSETQLRDLAEFFVLRVIGGPLQLRLRASRVARHVERLRDRERRHLRVRGTAEAVFHIARDARDERLVAAVHGLLDLVVQHGGLGRLAALPEVPAVPRGEREQYDQHEPRSGITPLRPPCLETLDRFLFVVVTHRVAIPRLF